MDEIKQLGIGLILGSLVITFVNAPLIDIFIIGISGWMILIIKVVYDDIKKPENLSLREN